MKKLKNIRKIIAVSFATIIMIGGGYYYVKQRANQSFKNVVTLIETELPGSSIQYKHHSINIFSGNITLYQVSFKDVNGYLYTADKILMPLNINSPLKHITADNIFFNIKNGPNIRIEHSHINNVQYALGFLKIIDNKVKNIVFSKFKLDYAKLQNVMIVWSDPKLTIKIGSYEINNYGINQKTNSMISHINMERNAGKDYFKITNIHIDGFDLAKVLDKIQNKKLEPFSLIKSAPKLFQVNHIRAFWSQEPWKVDKIESQLDIHQNGNIKWTGKISAKQFPLYRFFYWDAVGYMLQTLQYNIVNVSGRIQATYTKNDNYWLVNPLVIKIKDLGDLTLNAKFKQPESINWQDFKESPLSPMLQEYKYVVLSATLQNQGLIERFIEIASKKKKNPIITVKQNMIKDLQDEVAEAEYPLQRDATQTLIGVLTNPSSPIIIDFRSKTPISFEDFNDKMKDRNFEGLDVTIKN